MHVSHMAYFHQLNLLASIDLGLLPPGGLSLRAESIELQSLF